MTTKSEPKFFYEILRILDNARVGNKAAIAQEAEKIAIKFEKKGMSDRAERLRIRSKRLASGSKQLEYLSSATEQLGFELFQPSESKEKSRQFVPNEENKIVIDEIIQIVRKKEMFWEEEVPIPNKTIMFGPPGTGKTISAHYISSALDLPLILVRLDALIDSALGGTAKNIRKIFDLANKQPCVLFLDEFDAIANNRKTLNGNDVGNEMKRVVNSLLQNLDALNDECMLFAATNLDEEIDPAIWRRFHNRMYFRAPNEEELLTYLFSKTEFQSLLIYEIAPTLLGKSFSEIEIILNKARTKCILRSEPLSKQVIVEALEENIAQQV